MAAMSSAIETEIWYPPQEILFDKSHNYTPDNIYVNR